MEKFSQQLTNKIMNLFLCPSENQNLGSDFHQPSHSCYLPNPLQNQTVKISLILAPKSDIYQCIEILRLELSHNYKTEDDHPQKFQDLEVIINDQPAQLSDNLSFINKFFVSCCFLSPYINFFSNKHLEMDLLKRKFVMDYRIEHKPVSEMNPIVSHPGNLLENCFAFNRKIENSEASLQISMSVPCNLQNALAKIRMIDQIRQQTTKGPRKHKRNRFFSEDIDCVEAKEPNTRPGVMSSRRSELRLKVSEEQQLVNRTDLPRPFKFLNEVCIDDDLLELSGEDEAITNNALQENKKFFSASVFTEDHVSQLSKIKNEPCFTVNEKTEMVNFQDFQDDPSLENLYYMSKKINKFLNLRSKIFADDESYSSKSYNATGILNRKDSTNTLNKRNFIRFFN